MSRIIFPSFFLEGDNVGCLLAHGLTGTPFEMYEFGRRLNSHGFTVAAPRLAGHATDNGEDLTRTTWVDWHATLEIEYQRLRSTCDKILLIGLSVGGALSLWLAANRPKAASALVVMATPVSPHLLNVLPIFGRCGWLNRPLVKLFKRILPYVAKRGSAIADPIARDSHITGHHKALTAVDSLFDLMPVLRSRLCQVSAPTLLIYSKKDPTVNPQNGYLLFDSIASTQKEIVWLKNSQHIITRDYDKQIVFDHVLALAERVRAGTAIILPMANAQLDSGS